MDVLHDIFEVIQLRGTLYFRTDFNPPWGTTVPELGRAARFHHVVQGQCWIKVAGQPPVRLDQGDFVMVPNGTSHILSDVPVDHAPPLEQVLAAAGYRGDQLLTVGKSNPAAATQLVCGHFVFNAVADHPLLRALPPLIHLAAKDHAQRPWFGPVLQLLVDNVFSDHPGAIAAVTRLSEILFIEAVHSAGDEAPDLRRVMQGFTDPRIGRAIAVIHREPQTGWTVEALAQQAGMSRTRFAALFHDLVGMAPISYLSEWRLQRAAAALQTSRATVAEIAHANGYGNSAAFSRAFSEKFGLAPRDLRRQAS